MHSILASRINQFSNPLFPPIEFKCKWLDNVRAYAAGGMSEPFLLTFAAHDFLKTARTTDRTDTNGLLGFNLEDKLSQHLPDSNVFKATQSAFEDAIRIECALDVPGLGELHSEMPLGILIDTYRRYGRTNAYGAADPTALEKRNAGRHFLDAMGDHLVSWAKSDLDDADTKFLDLCTKIEAALETVSKTYGPDNKLFAISMISDAQDIRNGNKIRY